MAAKGATGASDVARSRLSRFVTILAGALAAMVGASTPGTAEEGNNPPSTALLIVEAHPTGAGAAAGLLPDDWLVSWRRPEPTPESAELLDAAAWLWLVEVESPAGTLHLAGVRRGAPFEMELPPGRWGISVRPRLDGEREDEATGALLEALAREPPLPEALETPGAARRLDELVAAAVSRGDGPLAWWLELRHGEAHYAGGRLEEAEERFRRAADSATGHELVWPRLLALDRLAATVQTRGQQEEAETLLRQAARLAEETWGESLPLARALFALALHLSDRERLDEAIGLLERALELRQRLAPESLQVASALDRIGMLARRRGDAAGAIDYHRRALEIRRQLDPPGAETAITLNSLGLGAWRQGDLEAASQWLTEAREHLQQSAPDSPILISVLANLGLVARERGALLEAERFLVEAIELEEARGALRSDRSLAITLNSLGMVSADRGDLTAAAGHYSRALGIFEAIAPGSRPTAMFAANLGLVALDQGELDDAERHLRHALTVEQTLFPDSMGLAFSHNNMGKLYYARGDFEEAEAHYQRSLAIKERHAPEAMTTANTLANLGHLARERGDLEAARSLYQRALGIRRALGPGGVFEALGLAELGRLATEQGELEEAEELLGRARQIVSSLAPGSSYEARALRFLGELYRARGDLQAAARTFEEALVALEAQVGKLPGGEGTQARYRAQHLGYYREAIEVLLELGRGEDAFQVLERSRGRILVDMLAERDLLFAADIPEELAEAQHRNRREIDRLQERLAAVDPQRQAADTRGLQEELALALRRRDELVETVRRASPRLAALRYPRPLEAAAAQALLEPGTLFLAYSVSPSGTDVFVLGRDDFRVVRLPVGEEELRGEIEHFRRLIQRGRLETAIPEALLTQGKRLWELLLAPLEPDVAASRRLLISPDGPLHLLPFAALVRPSRPRLEEGGDPDFLARSHPVGLVLSASLLEELRFERDRRGQVEDEARPPTLVAFGDPLGPGPGGELGAPLHTAMLPRHALTPLPGSRAEVEALAQRFGSAARTFVGPKASEARAREEAGRARFLHFATHGVLNELFPLSSALVLAPGDGHNGLLQAWEIFEDVRLDGDLVTLSACETALGAEVRGEGLVGLTRAFQYAGARGVVASLWRVADLSTASLMEHFYESLDEGRPVAEALVEAQRRVAARPATAHPYHWAGFVLHGDWH
jgi:CHAT domain-containing protein/Tfp pilus assembly protein PilF